METNKLNLGNIGKKQIPLLRGRVQQMREGEYAILKEAEIGKEYFVLCPSCGKPVILRPSKRVNNEYCKVCNAKISYCAKGEEGSAAQPRKESKAAVSSAQPTQKVETYTEKRQSPHAQLVWGFLSRKRYELKLGVNIVGRADDEQPSDVQINDNYASRRSVSIEPVYGTKGFSFKMKILNASNPVIVRNVIQPVGTELYLNYGESFVLGKTTITLKKM